MDCSCEILLQKIREEPKKYLIGRVESGKSLKQLQLFSRAYQIKLDIDAWEKETGLDFVNFCKQFHEHFDEIEKALEFAHRNTEPHEPINFVEFDYFVHTYYDRMIIPSTKLSAMDLIEELSSSEEEAFDRYFELWDAYMKQVADNTIEKYRVKWYTTPIRMAFIDRAYEILLQKIRENPKEYLIGESKSGKSLKQIQLFSRVYQIRLDIDLWEKETGYNFFNFCKHVHMHFDEIEKASQDSEFFSRNPGLPIHSIEFNYFVHTYYNHMINIGGTIMPKTTHNAISLIEQMSNSEEEAFDKYFELRDEYMKQVADKTIETHRAIWYNRDGCPKDT